MSSTLIQADLLSLRQNLSVIQSLQQRLLQEVVPHLADLHGWNHMDRERAKAFIRDTATIFRFFKRADECQPETIETIQAHLLWRREHNPEMIHFDHLDKSYVNLFNFMSEECCDRFDRPVAILRLKEVKRSDDGSLDGLKQFIIWSFECARRYLRDLKLDEQSPCLTFTILVDLEGASMSNIEPEILPFLLDIGRKQYPGLCSNVFVLRFGWWWASTWTILKRLLPTSTLAKIAFPSEKELFQLYFERSSLPPEYNGTYVPKDDHSFNEVQLRYSYPEFSPTIRSDESSKYNDKHPPQLSTARYHGRSSSFFEPEIETESSVHDLDGRIDECSIEPEIAFPEISSCIELTLPQFYLCDRSKSSHIRSSPLSSLPSTYGSAESLGSEISSYSQASSTTRRRATISEISIVRTSNLFEVDPFVARTYAKEITTHHLGAFEPIASADQISNLTSVSKSELSDDLVLDTADSPSVTSYASCRSRSSSPTALPTCKETSARPQSTSRIAPRDRNGRHTIRTIIFLVMLKTKNIKARLALLLGFSHITKTTPSSPPRYKPLSISSPTSQSDLYFEQNSQFANSRMITCREPPGLRSSELKALVLATIVFVLREVYENLVPNVVVSGLGGGLSVGAGLQVVNAWGVLGKLIGLSG